MKFVPFPAFGKSPSPPCWDEALESGEIDFVKCDRLSPLILNKYKLQDLRKRNRYYNWHITYVPDRKLYGLPDHWRPVDEDGGPKYLKGDCEDIALTKWRKFHLMGYPTCFQIALCFHKTLGPHAVLIVRVEKDGKRGALVLDNLHSRVLPYQKTGLRFIAVSGPEGWQRVWA